MLQSEVMCLSSLFKRIALEELLFSFVLFCCSVLLPGWKLSCQQRVRLYIFCGDNSKNLMSVLSQRIIHFSIMESELF